VALLHLVLLLAQLLVLLLAHAQWNAHAHQYVAQQSEVSLMAACAVVDAQFHLSAAAGKQ
jgi:hypothetical protein